MINVIFDPILDSVLDRGNAIKDINGSTDKTRIWKIGIFYQCEIYLS